MFMSALYAFRLLLRLNELSHIAVHRGEILRSSVSGLAAAAGTSSALIGRRAP